MSILISFIVGEIYDIIQGMAEMAIVFSVIEQSIFVSMYLILTIIIVFIVLLYLRRVVRSMNNFTKKAVNAGQAAVMSAITFTSNRAREKTNNAISKRYGAIGGTASSNLPPRHGSDRMRSSGKKSHPVLAAPDDTK